MKIPSSQLASHDQICLLLRKTSAQVDESVSKHGLPREKGKAKQYNLQRVIYWLLDQHKKDVEDSQRKRIEWQVGDIAAALHRDVRTINILAKEKGMPRVSRGVYNIVDVFRFIIKELEHKLEEAKAGGEDALNAKRKEAMYDALIREMEYFERAKKLVNVEDIARLITIPWKATQTKMRSLPRQLAPQLVGLTTVEIEEALENKINDCLTETANIPIASIGHISPQTGDLGFVEGAPSSAKSHRKRVGRRVSHLK
jgi:hypothetical protein